MENYTALMAGRARVPEVSKQKLRVRWNIAGIEPVPNISRRGRLANPIKDLPYTSPTLQEDERGETASDWEDQDPEDEKEATEDEEEEEEDENQDPEEDDPIRTYLNVERRLMHRRVEVTKCIAGHRSIYYIEGHRETTEATRSQTAYEKWLKIRGVKFKCPWCPRSYGIASSVRRHIRENCLTVPPDVREVFKAQSRQHRGS